MKSNSHRNESGEVERIAFFKGVKSMLVLSREVNQEIEIGDSIRVMVVEIRGDKVRLGITAPRDMAVHRKEIAEAIRREASDGSP